MVSRVVGFVLAAIGFLVVAAVWTLVEAPALRPHDIDPGAAVELIVQGIGLIVLAMGIQLMRRGTLRFQDRPRR
jgi:hypothetical protein